MIALLAWLWTLPLMGAGSETVDALFARYKTPGSPGCAVTVVKDGKQVHLGLYGLADVEQETPIGPQTAFYLGSTSKQFTAMTVLMLVEMGRMKLDDPIHKYLPQLPAYMKPVTVRHLLEHTSGIRDYFALWTLSGPPNDAVLGDTKAFDLIARQKELNFAPGAEFLYSNSGYFLLSMAIRPAAMSHLNALAGRLIFEPLGLRRTLYYIDRFALLPKRAEGYSPVEGGAGVTAFQRNGATLDVAGDGGVFTTIEDVTRWLEYFGAPKDPQAKALAAMQTRGQLASGEQAEYGRGLMLKQYRGMESMSHVGGLRGYRSEIFWLPSERLGTAVLCNRSDAPVGPLARTVADAYLPPRKPLEPPPLTMQQLARKAGTFRDRDTGDLLVLQPSPPGLSATYQSFQMLLLPGTPMRFRSVNSPLDFEIEFRDGGAKDEPKFVRIEAESHKPAVYERVEWRPGPIANPGQYEGVYRSEEALSEMTVRYFDSRLTLEVGGQTTGELAATGTDRFQAGAVNILFERDDSKAVKGMLVTTGRVRKLAFTRTGPVQ
ncbi:MAG: beta-lactamase family protein [Bryobacterales bacterium]|nr:beta-lactamase family protein [Bryobacterales bacterium]